MKNKVVYVLILIILIFYSLLSNAKVLQIFEGQKVEVPSTGSLVVDKLDNIKINDKGAKYEIIGKKKGTTFFKVNNEIYNVFVLSLKQQNTYDLLKNSVLNQMGTKVEIVNGEIQLNGYLFNFSILDKIKQDCFLIGCDFSNHLKLDEENKTKLKKLISSDLQNNNLNEIKLDLNLFNAFLSSKNLNSKKYEKLLTAYGFNIDKDENILDLEPMIKVQITIAELKRNQTLKYGLKWPSQYSAQLLSNEIDPILLNLNALEQNGEGKILAHPSLICRNDKEAEFLAGGEIPIKIVNFKTQEISWKKYGILLRVKPKADRLGHMSVSIETEVSSIDGAHRVDGIPAFFTNKVQSFFDLKEKQTIALSGLIKSEQSKSTEGLPFLSNVPILSTLFASKDFIENRSELVVFVTPEVISNNGEGLN